MQSVKKEIVMGGIRPTGFLHLGNYFGALRNFVRMQDEYPCYFMLADLHSLTTHHPLLPIAHCLLPFHSK